MSIFLAIFYGLVFSARQKAMNCPLVHLAATESPTAAEWLSRVTLEEVTQNVLSGETSLPELALRAVEPPSELLAAAPELPQLNICTVTGGTL